MQPTSSAPAVRVRMQSHRPPADSGRAPSSVRPGTITPMATPWSPSSLESPGLPSRSRCWCWLLVWLAKELRQIGGVARRRGREARQLVGSACTEQRQASAHHGRPSDSPDVRRAGWWLCSSPTSQRLGRGETRISALFSITYKRTRSRPLKAVGYLGSGNACESDSGMSVQIYKPIESSFGEL